MDDREAYAERVIPESATLRGALWEPWIVEGLAQTAAVLHGNNQRANGSRTRKGMLVGIRDLVIHRRPSAGEVIRFHVTLIKRLGALTLMEGELTVGTELVARGQMKFYVEVE